MARDRLAAMRANNSPHHYAQPASPPSLPRSHDYQAPPKSSSIDQDLNLSSPDDPDQINSYEMKEKYLDMSSFMDEVSSLNDGIRTINENVDKIKDFHNRLLSELDDHQHQSITSQLQLITDETSRLTKNLKNRIRSLQASISSNQLPPLGDANARATQIGALKKRLMDSIMKYQSVEQESRQKYKARMERQYRIVKPDATPEEIRQAVDSDDGGQIFSQALMTSNRYGDARAAFNEVKERHEDIKRIEKTITELMEMFNDLATMVEEQDQLVQNVENNAAEIEHDVEHAGQHITKARNSAAAARRKRWICFFVLLLIVLIVAAIIAIVIVTQTKKNTSNPSTPA